MKYIEISDGVSIKIDAIEAVERKDDFTSTVHTQSNSYDSTFPYLVLLELLEKQSVPEPTETGQKVLNILEETGVTSP